MSVSSARTRCGLYMAAKKRPKFDAFVDYAWARGIDIVDLALDDAPDVFTPHLGLDVVLHKFTDDLATAHGDAGAARRLANFEALLASHTHTHLALVDPLPGIRPLLNRAEMQRVLADVIATHAIDADLPKWVAISDADRHTETMRLALQAAGMRPPFLCKPEAACGVRHSHDMAVFSDSRQLEQYTVPAPFTIQEFLNHGGVVFKIYVLGDTWFADSRESLPDAHATTPLTPFNSQSLKAAAAEPALHSRKLHSKRDIIQGLGAETHTH